MTPSQSSSKALQISMSGPWPVHCVRVPVGCSLFCSMHSSWPVVQIPRSTPHGLGGTSSSNLPSQSLSLPSHTSSVEMLHGQMAGASSTTMSQSSSCWLQTSWLFPLWSLHSTPVPSALQMVTPSSHRSASGPSHGTFF